jgi:hypothetical protein
MAAASALTLFEKMLRQLEEVADGLRLLNEAGWPRAESGVNAAEVDLEAAHAARSVAAKATEVARDALHLCSRYDEPAGPRTSSRKRDN